MMCYWFFLFPLSLVIKQLLVLSLWVDYGGYSGCYIMVISIHVYVCVVGRCCESPGCQGGILFH